VPGHVHIHTQRTRTRRDTPRCSHDAFPYFQLLRPVLVSLGTEPNLPMGTLRGVVRAAGDFTTEALGLASPQPGGQAE
ncbi:hypothetical protein N9M16_07055, partial [Candidatus Dependentiae bacterium]|nr:hypothetical protein [Candidatus Dependentiae bacterium]